MRFFSDRIGVGRKGGADPVGSGRGELAHPGEGKRPGEECDEEPDVTVGTQVRLPGLRLASEGRTRVRPCHALEGTPAAARHHEPVVRSLGPLPCKSATYPEAVPNPEQDVAEHSFSIRNARWRTWLRVHTPGALYRRGLVIPKARDCGDHKWHLRGGGLDACYHCEVARPSPPVVASQEPETHVVLRGVD